MDSLAFNVLDWCLGFAFIHWFSLDRFLGFLGFLWFFRFQWKWISLDYFDFLAHLQYILQISLDILEIIGFNIRNILDCISDSGISGTKWITMEGWESFIRLRRVFFFCLTCDYIENGGSSIYDKNEVWLLDGVPLNLCTLFLSTLHIQSRGN